MFPVKLATPRTDAEDTQPLSFFSPTLCLSAFSICPILSRCSPLCTPDGSCALADNKSPLTEQTPRKHYTDSSRPTSSRPIYDATRAVNGPDASARLEDALAGFWCLHVYRHLLSSLLVASTLVLVSGPNLTIIKPRLFTSNDFIRQTIHE